MSELTDLLERVDGAVPPLPMVKLTLERCDKCGVYDSKIGGHPYFPKGMEYPRCLTGEYAGKPLRLLAQLNFETLPRIEGFPEKGILQFYCSPDDGTYGIDFDDQRSQDGFRVIYHADVIRDEALLCGEEDIPEIEGDDFPLNHECRLIPGAAEKCGVTPSDFRFEEFMDDPVLQDDEANDELYKLRELTGSRIGGYPFFTQSDPRGYTEDIADADILLFQLDSEGEDDWEVLWGDCGVANFFISREELKALDFSRVVYNWDCC